MVDPPHTVDRAAGEGGSWDTGPLEEGEGTSSVVRGTSGVIEAQEVGAGALVGVAEGLGMEEEMKVYKYSNYCVVCVFKYNTLYQLHIFWGTIWAIKK